jgi:hypothetical protein
VNCPQKDPSGITREADILRTSWNQRDWPGADLPSVEPRHARRGAFGTLGAFLPGDSEIWPSGFHASEDYPVTAGISNPWVVAVVERRTVKLA